MSAQEQVERLRTLQESMHEIADKVVSLGDGSVMLNDVAEGKKQIADAINTKGGNASADSSFQKLAEDIKDLPIDGIFMNYGLTFSSEVELQNILLMSDAYTNIMNEVVEINDYKGLIKTTKQNFYYDKLKKATFPNLYQIENKGGFDSPKLEELFVPNMEHLEYYLVRSNNIRNIHIGTLKIMFNGGVFYSVVDKLRNITIGYNTDVSLLLQKWEAKEVILEGQSGIDELNNNLRTNLLEKLADHSTDGQTRTLRLGWLAKVSQENIDYANSKGWTLTT
jgi:hypothetical protein